MTIPRPGGYTAARQSLAQNLGRAAATPRGGIIRPYVVAWPRSADSFGCAFPAGTVGVALSFTMPSLANGKLVSTYAADILTALQNVAYAVPGALPAGYTARMLRDAYASSSASGEAHGLGVKIRTATGALARTWVPALVQGGATETVSGYEDGNSFIDFLGRPSRIATTIGWRRIGFQLSFLLPSPASSFNVTGGSCTFNVSHNADGSAIPNVGIAGGGDTVDGTLTFNGSEFVNMGPSFGSILWQTGWKYLTNVLPTLGTVSKFYSNASSCALSGTFSGSPITNLGSPTSSLQQSYRVDVPFPFTATGDGGAIAVGGLVT